MAEISEYIGTREAAERAGLGRSQLINLIGKGTIAAQRVGSVWLVNVPSLEHYMANRPRPGLKPGQKITRPRKIASA
jgi:excisionase family DNA binding protein